MAAILASTASLCLHGQNVLVHPTMRSKEVPQYSGANTKGISLSPSSNKSRLASPILGSPIREPSAYSTRKMEIKSKPRRSGAAVAETAQDILNSVNQLRARHHAPPVSWDDSLASYARNWSNHLIQTGGFEHSRGPHGENLFAGSGSNWKAQDAIDMWYDEVSQYDYNNPGFSSATGHFTQLVWKGTTRIGAGIAKGNDRTVITMSFEEFGNMKGAFADNVLPP